MKWIFAALITALVSSAFAANTCERLFKAHGWDYMHLRYVFQEGGDYEPMGSVVAMAVRTLRQNGRIEEYRYNAGWPLPNSLDHLWPMQHRAELVMTGINKTQFFERVYGKYDAKFSHELMEKLAIADESLEMSRSTYAEVRTRDQVLGTWRWFQARAPNHDLPLDEIKVLPYVRINRLRGAPELKVTETLNRFMQEGVGVTEIGKFSVLAEDPATRDRVTHLIEMDWLAKAEDDVIYVAHVTTPAHARLYKKYGFEIAEEFDVPGNPKKEAVLWVRGHMLKKALEEYLNVEPYRGWIPNVKPLLPAELREKREHPERNHHP